METCMYISQVPVSPWANCNNRSWFNESRTRMVQSVLPLFCYVPHIYGFKMFSSFDLFFASCKTVLWFVIVYKLIDFFFKPFPFFVSKRLFQSMYSSWVRLTGSVWILSHCLTCTCTVYLLQMHAQYLAPSCVMCHETSWVSQDGKDFVFLKRSF